MLHEIKHQAISPKDYQLMVKEVEEAVASRTGTDAAVGKLLSLRMVGGFWSLFSEMNAGDLNYNKGRFVIVSLLERLREGHWPIAKGGTDMRFTNIREFLIRQEERERGNPLHSRHGDYEFHAIYDILRLVADRPDFKTTDLVYWTRSGTELCMAVPAALPLGSVDPSQPRA